MPRHQVRDGQSTRGRLFRIKSVEDVYHALTDKEALEKVLPQGLKDKNKQYKDEIVEFLLNMKNRTKVNYLTLYSLVF